MYWRAKILNDEIEWSFDVYGNTQAEAFRAASYRLFEPVTRDVKVVELGKKYSKLRISVSKE